MPGRRLIPGERAAAEAGFAFVLGGARSRKAVWVLVLRSCVLCVEVTPCSQLYPRYNMSFVLLRVFSCCAGGGEDRGPICVI